MVESTQDLGKAIEPETVSFAKYDRRSLSYASTFEDPWKATFIRVMEAFTGKLTILRMIRKFERRGAPSGQAFWRAALDTMGIELTTPRDQLDRIPKTGPV
ncbi:MAG: acyltransferase, partial [Pseudomonadota bacterium]